MKVFVLTRGRGKEMQLTAESLHDAGVRFSFARTLGDDTDLGYPDVEQIVFDAKTGADKRQFIFDQNSKMLMLDDDLRFYRVEGGRPLRASPEDVRSMIAYAEELLNLHGLVGLENRLWINSKRQPYIKNPPKLHHFFAINKMLLSGKERFDRFPGHADIDFSLQVLTSGASVVSMTRFCHTDVGQATRKGGANCWRTRQSDDEMANAMKRAWPGIVKTYQRKGGITGVHINTAALRAAMPNTSGEQDVRGL